MPPWPLTQHDSTQWTLNPWSAPFFNHPKSNMWWKYLFMAHPKYQDDFSFPPHEDLEIEHDHWEWKEYCADAMPWGLR